MSDLNPTQKVIAETLNGMIVVDAGPGTGKTKTVVDRYVNLISQEGVVPSDVLMLTFTRNAAAEMEERIKNVMAERGMIAESKLVQVKTFDAFCLSIVMDSPEEAGSLFGLDDRLTHSVHMIQNETLNRSHFNRFMDWFLENFGEDYGDWAIIAEKNRMDLYDLINRLMARGIYPVKGNGWFGGNDGNDLYGDPDRLLELLESSNADVGKENSLVKFINKMEREKYGEIPAPCTDNPFFVDRAILISAVNDRRANLVNMIHDVYFHYIRRSISEDRLTFGLNAMLAFSILFNNESVRKHNSFRFVMIDEFQDTNAAQLMMTLMIMSEPNLCVVGDWKQGIYGFRYVSTENIEHFDERVRILKSQLNDDRIRVPFTIPPSVKLPLRTNYRSAQCIIDSAFECLKIPANDLEENSMNGDEIESRLVRLDAERQSELGPHCGVRYSCAGSKDREGELVAKAISDYLGDPDCIIHTKEGQRRARYGDIAILCRTGNTCKAIKDILDQQHIPAFLQGDVEIMSTREGKLALAWLRFINNSRDPWGYIPIMVDMGYSLEDCNLAKKGEGYIPTEIIVQRRNLFQKRRRITDLLTSLFAWYGLDNDITQAIINILSDVHRGSLLTISDLISIIEEDMCAGSKSTYPVEMELESDAVRIMTMHKSKGLEFPIVILPYIDQGLMPLTQRETSTFTFDEIRGVRSSDRVIRFDNYAGIYRSWQYDLIKEVIPKDYGEERRLLFVAMSRAKQYQTLICGDKPSRFMKWLSNEQYEEIPDRPMTTDSQNHQPIAKPDVSGYVRRVPSMGVHSILDFRFEDGMGSMSEVDEYCYKGKEYGESVHMEAQMMHEGVPPSGKYPESIFVRENVLSRRNLDGFIQSYSEIDCVLPLDEIDIRLRGTIDLILVFEDRVEIHDYKTDETDRFQSEYEIQLSIYAEAVSRFYNGLPVRCYLDYVSQGRTFEFERIPIDRLLNIIRERMGKIQSS